MLAACSRSPEEEATEEFAYLNSALSKFVVDDFAGTANSIENAGAVRNSFAETKQSPDSCEIWISFFYFELKEEIYNYSKWMATHEDRWVTTFLTDTTELSAMRSFLQGNPSNYDARESRMCDVRFHDLTVQRQRAEALVITHRDGWIVKMRNTLGEKRFLEISEIADRSHNFENAMALDRFKSWKDLTEAERDMISDGKPEVRACLNELLQNEKATSGLSKRDLANACEQALSR